jgi:hypothetical protein
MFDSGFLLSNDSLKQGRLSDIYSHPDPDCDGRVSILVGESHFLSVLPLLKSRTVIIVDIDPRVHQCVQDQCDILRRAETFEEFKDCMTPLLREVSSLDSGLEDVTNASYDAWLNSVESTIPDSTINSPERFLEAKEALENTRVIFSGINLMNTNHTARLGNALNRNGLNIKFLNVTNLPSYTLYTESVPYGNTLCHAVSTLLSASQSEDTIIVEGITIKRYESPVDFYKSFSDEQCTLIVPAA